MLTSDDIGPFIQLITGGAPSPVPEPAAFFLLGVGGLMAVAHRRKK